MNGYGCCIFLAYLGFICSCCLVYMFVTESVKKYLALIIVLLLPVAFYVYLYLNATVPNIDLFSYLFSIAPTSESPLKIHSDIGQAFGILNTIFSGLAFVAVYQTFATQREQLKAQKDELQIQLAEHEQKQLIQLIDELSSKNDKFKEQSISVNNEICSRDHEYRIEVNTKNKSKIRDTFCEKFGFTHEFYDLYEKKKGRVETYYDCLSQKMSSDDNGTAFANKNDLMSLITSIGNTPEKYERFCKNYSNLHDEKPEYLFMEEKKDSIVEVLNKKLDDSLELYLQILIGLLTHYIKHKNDHLTVMKFEFWKSKLTWKQMYTISIYAFFYSGKYDRLRELLIESKLFDYFLRIGETSRDSSFSHLQWFKEKAT